VRSTLATVGDRPIHVTGPVDKLELDAEEREAAERLRRNEVTRRDLASVMGLELRVAELLAYFLVITKTAEVGTAGVVPPPASARALPPEGRAPQPVRPSGQYTRAPSFTMKAVQPGSAPLRIPSPVPPALRPPSSSPDTASPAVDGTQGSLEAEHALSQAEMHLVLGDRGQAIAFTREALALEPAMPEAQAFLAYLEVQGLDSDEDRYTEDSLTLLDSVLRRKETCRRAHYYRAEVKKRLGDHEGAILDLRVAVTQDPNDVEARRELRIYEQKVRDGSIDLTLGSSGARARPKGLLDRFRGTKS
jgi:tetratricopeptide (TPR) repeat protein